MDYKKEIKKAIEEGKLIIGSREIIKKLKMDKLNLIVVAKNCPENIRKDLEYYSKIAEVDVVEFDGTERDLGIFCGKPFPIAAVAIE